MKKSLLLTSITILFVVAANAQQWMKAPYLKTDKQTADYFTICNAFNQYWGNKPYEKGHGYKQFKRWEYFMESRSYPDGKLYNPQRYLNAKNDFAKKYSDNSVSKYSGNWSPLGITEWTNGNSGYNPGNGRINFIAVHPTNPNTILIAAPSGGIWKTIDGGATWNTTYDSLTLLGTSCVVFDPVNPNIVYVGTGDRDASDTQSLGLLKSVDGGNTWQTTPLTYSTPNSNSINKILINPLKTSTIFFATESGVYRSLNAGNSWTQIYSGSRVTDLKYRPGDTTTIYGGGEKFIRSVDNGQTFNPVTSGTPDHAARFEIAVTQADPNYVYILVANDTNYAFRGIYRSTNSGANFSTRCELPNILGYDQSGNDDAGQGWYDLAIEASPTDAERIFTGGVNVWTSADGGVNMSLVSQWYYNSGFEYTHADIHFIGFYGSKLYVGSDGGIFVSADQGNTFSDLSAGLGITQFYAMGTNGKNPDIIAAGAQDNGSNILQSGAWTHIYGADGFEAIVDPVQDGRVFSSWQNGGINRSDDYGDNQTDISVYTDPVGGAWLTPYCMHPSDHLMLFAGYGDVYKTTDAGNTWNAISTNLTSGSSIKELAVAPSDPNTIYASVSSGLYRTHDGGSTWQSSTPFPGLYIKSIAIDETNPNKLWICGTSSSQDRVLYSVNGGQSFTNITGTLTDLGFNCIVHQQGAYDALYLGTETGVYFRDTLSNQWVSFSVNLPNVIVSELEINYNLGLIRAATFGRGIWETFLSSTGINEEINNSELLIFPNPAGSIVNIEFQEPLKNDCELLLFNIIGKKLASVKALKGSKTQQINLEKFVSGTYFLRAEINGKLVIRKIIHVN
ncbi:MAG: T9SS type A sorting domain-containing protein [Bacteroidota bacterium]